MEPRIKRSLKSKKEKYKSNKRSRLLSKKFVDAEEEKEREKVKRKMKYDFVCQSDPVSHINNRKTTTQDKNSKEKHKRDSSFTAFLLFLLLT